MHRSIIDVRAKAVGDVEAVVARLGSLTEMLLLVANVVLGACHDALALDALNGLGHHDASQHRIGTVIASQWVRDSGPNVLDQAHLKPSQLRPPSGARPRGPATGPSCMSTPFP